MGAPANSNRVRAIVDSGNVPLVHLQKGQLVTDSLAIATEFQRMHKNVLQSLDVLIADCAISRLDFKPQNYLDVRGKKQRMIELTERGALIAMPFIGGKKSRLGQMRLVDAFLRCAPCSTKAGQIGKRIGSDWPRRTASCPTHCMKHVPTRVNQRDHTTTQTKPVW